MAAAGSLPVTFHRAVDMADGLQAAVEAIVRLGATRVLTSGGESTALEGAYALKDMLRWADGRVLIVPAGGINSKNLQRILDIAPCQEYHASARRAVASRAVYRNGGVHMGGALYPPEYGYKAACPEIVRELVDVVAVSDSGKLATK